LPALRAAGLGDAEIHALLVRNPAEAFGIRRRVARPS
jgi:predicted metal-dependent phosphotriesterase family hydrolase